MITGVSPMFCVFVSFCPSVTSIGVELVSIAFGFRSRAQAQRPRQSPMRENVGGGGGVRHPDLTFPAAGGRRGLPTSFRVRSLGFVVVSVFYHPFPVFAGLGRRLDSCTPLREAPPRGFYFSIYRTTRHLDG